MPKQNTDERRQQIASALLAVMSEHGYVRASIKKIAQEAGLTPGLVHYHFKTKQEILLQLVDDLGAAPIRALEAIASSEASPADRLDAVIDSFLSTGDTANPDLVSAWVVVTGESVRQPEVAAAFKGVIATCQGIIAGILEQGARVGQFEFGRLTPADVAAGLMATVQGYFTFAAASRDLVPSGSAAPVARAFLRSFAAGKEEA